MGRAGKILVATVLATLTTMSGAALAGPPTATTSAASDVGATTATLNASVFPNKEATTYYFEYGTTTAYGTRTPDGGPDGRQRRQVGLRGPHGARALDHLPLPGRRHQPVGHRPGRRRDVHDDGGAAGRAGRHARGRTRPP